MSVATETTVPAGATRPARAGWFSRAAFRRRLDEDPRPWVLALAAAGGLVGFALGYGNKVSTQRPGYMLLVPIGFALVAPAAAVLAMLLHGRLLLWAGRILGGRARCADLHAAFAWSQLPIVAVGWPAVLAMVSRVARAEHDPVPAWLAFSDDLLRALAAWAHPVGAIAGVASGVLFVGYLAEAQRFTIPRALANELLALVLGVAVVGAGAGLGWALVRSL